MILTHGEHNSPYLAGSFSFSYRVQLKSEDLSHYPLKLKILETTLMSWAQRHTDIATREGRGARGGGGVYSTNSYKAEAHPLTFHVPFFTISCTFY